MHRTGWLWRSGFCQRRREQAVIGFGDRTSRRPSDVNSTIGIVRVDRTDRTLASVDAVHLPHVHVEDREVEAFAGPQASAALRPGCRGLAVLRCPQRAALQARGSCDSSRGRRRPARRLPTSAGCSPRKLRRVGIASPGSARGASDREMEGRTTTRSRALDPHRAAHQLRQLPADREAEPGAAVLARGADESACAERLWNSLPMTLASDSPMPVSRTVKLDLRLTGRPGS